MLVIGKIVLEKTMVSDIESIIWDTTIHAARALNFDVHYAEIVVVLI